MLWQVQYMKISYNEKICNNIYIDYRSHLQLQQISC